MTIKVSEVPGPKGAHVGVADRISRAIERLARPGVAAVLDDSDFRVEYDPSGAARSLSVWFGKETTTARELERIVHLTLGEKARQLGHVGADGNPCLLALDCRSLVPAADPGPDAIGEERYRQLLEWQEAVLRAGYRFLSETPWLSGILICWARSAWHMTYHDVIHQPFKLVLLTRCGQTEVTSPGDLRGAISTL